MHKTLVNEAVLSFSLRTEVPLLINSGMGSKVNPTLPDMSFVRCAHNGKETVYMPGSSLKGVFRARYEQLAKTLGIPVCELFTYDQCSSLIGKNRVSGGTERYEASCAACRLFGSLAVAGRAAFADAYPPKDYPIALGMRHGVAIDRITGAASGGAKYEFEVLEDGQFDFSIRLSNFARYQLRMLLWALEDIEEGLVTFGMGGTRGNGQMRMTDRQAVKLAYRLYDAQEKDGRVRRLRGFAPDDEGANLDYSKSGIYNKSGIFGDAVEILGLDAILQSVDIASAETLRSAAEREGWGKTLYKKPAARR
jgi:CRISPR-associated RAMP protein (TIGR02581 family)